MKWTLILWSLVVFQRIWEVGIAKQNGEWMRRQGGKEVGREHYPLLVGVHVLFFLGILVEMFLYRATPPTWWWIPFTLFIGVQALRYWSIRSLGRFWNTRIWVLPNTPIERKGPYRYMRHPNYVAVVTEFLVFPLLFGAYVTCIVMTFVNILVLVLLRIPMEEQALKEVSLSLNEEEMEYTGGLFSRWDQEPS
ncbi:15-methylpalmitoyl-4-hydroxy-2-pyrone 4-O-methyltransferase [Thermoactinomyces sp. DSM 45891]|uniref:isoprenylcysteine carboxyl methyltransferase family protein n=1 Tax=Thermoactinomyces sp. DSM 45891 TaxID=1761907 RepID=UPI000910A065|nr:isoprenylcysteine carboxylmethyltransferase family protein [Thermoactinomyces sp. DSM 45891]SFX42003.1 15-methylpalmitoyl-4-hydroxy-2-pyrone 4-O-methyltransferase [Thermoactinomyces sp. DSM 45891]